MNRLIMVISTVKSGASSPMATMVDWSESSPGSDMHDCAVQHIASSAAETDSMRWSGMVMVAESCYFR